MRSCACSCCARVTRVRAKVTVRRPLATTTLPLRPHAAEDRHRRTPGSMPPSSTGTAGKGENAAAATGASKRAFAAEATWGSPGESGRAGSRSSAGHVYARWGSTSTLLEGSTALRGPGIRRRSSEEHRGLSTSIDAFWGERSQSSGWKGGGRRRVANRQTREPIKNQESKGRAGQVGDREGGWQHVRNMRKASEAYMQFRTRRWVLL